MRDFAWPPSTKDGAFPMTPEKITRALVKELRTLRFEPPVDHVYNPLEYAAAAHAQYIQRYGSSPADYVLLGMNPGPFGMVQTGIPFGEIESVRSWLGIDGAIVAPARQHPKRPILGFECTRSEVSGARLWGWAKERFGTPEAFFAQFRVLNYCPLAFLEEGGKNRTPDKLLPQERALLTEICDRALVRYIQFYKPRLVIGIGAYAEKRAREALAGVEVSIGRILHPSPASPLANRGWAAAAEKQLRDLKVSLP